MAAKKELTTEEKLQRIQDSIDGKLKTLFGSKPEMFFGVFHIPETEDTAAQEGYLGRGDVQYLPVALASALLEVYDLEGYIEFQGLLMLNLCIGMGAEQPFETALEMFRATVAWLGDYFKELQAQQINAALGLDDERIANAMTKLGKSTSKEVSGGVQTEDNLPGGQLLPDNSEDDRTVSDEQPKEVPRQRQTKRKKSEVGPGDTS